MAKNFVQSGETLSLAAPYAVNAGDGALFGVLFMVALVTLAIAAVGEFAREGVWDLTALNTDTATVGTKVYWDNTNRRCTVTAAGNTLIGVTTASKANGDLTIRVKLNESVA